MNSQVDMFDYFANLADMDISHTEKVGRYANEKSREKNIFQDIVIKLELKNKESILDIGCGCGTVVFDLIHYISTRPDVHVVLNDSNKVLSQIDNELIIAKNIKFIPGRFSDIKIQKDKKFDAIILYSVIHYISKNEIYNFIDLILERLEYHGLFLIGDIPNINKRKRFNNSQFGKEYNEKKSQNRTSCFISKNYPSMDLSFFNDKLIFNIIKYIRNKDGFNAYLLPQSEKLPFSYIRDDILIEKI